MGDPINDAGTFEPIAIVGIGAILPDAPDASSFWENVISGRASIRELPEHRWRAEDHWEQGGPKNVSEGKTYSKIGAWVNDYEFDWKRWRIPPGSLPQIDICQQWAVSVSAAALEDAGYLGNRATSELPRESTGVVFANALGGENRTRSTERVLIDRYERHAKEAGIPDEAFSRFKASVLEGAPRVDEDTMPGELANVVAGRVANMLDLKGPNFTTDAACASAMAAVMDACHLLHSGQVDVMIAGAADRTMDPATFAKFSAIGALSATKSVPFDRRADGFVMGEGAGALVLKRLDDAIAAGDRIYSVIRGIGASSDGRGKGITAPSQGGQALAINNAYSQAGYPVSSVELIEAHGTSTSVGDATELASLSSVYGQSNLPGTVAVGSIKSQIGHLKAAAGLAGILKASLSLHHRTIPPSAGFEQPNETVPWSEVPFYVPTVAGDWPKPTSNPRRAGVSAFGFGGTNFHVALEQYDPEAHSRVSMSWKAMKQRQRADGQGQRPTALTWDHLKALEGGVLLVNGSSTEAVVERLNDAYLELFDGATNFDDSPTGKRLSKALPAASRRFKPEGIRLSIVATSWSQLEKRITLAKEGIADPGRRSFLESQQILLEESPLDPGAKLAHMYPGQGSQYLGMTLDLAQRYHVVASTWKEADEIMAPIIGESLSGMVLNNNLTGEELELAQIRLTQTEFTQPAMLTADLAIDRLLAAHDIVPDMVAGHSLGEYAALMVSGILSFNDAMSAAAARGTEMGSVEVPDKGLMAAVGAPASKVEEALRTIDGYVIPANRNSPVSTVIAGETQAVQSASKMLSDLGATVIPLQTSHAFHTDIVSPANEPLRRFLESVDLSLPKIPVTANVDGSFYPMESENPMESILEKLAPQMSSPVNWIDQIETMHGAGARIFLEVGPKRALSSTVTAILGEGAKASSTNHPKVGGIATFLGSIAFLAVNGKGPVIDEWGHGLLSPEFMEPPSDTDLAAESQQLEALRTRSRPLPGSGAIPDTTTTTRTTGRTREPHPDYGLVASALADITGYPKSVLVGNVSLEEIGVDETSLRSVLRGFGHHSADMEWESGKFSTVADVERAVSIQPYDEPRPIDAEMEPPVVSGISLGVPGMDEVFDEGVWEAILEGRNLISEIPDEMKQRLVDQNIVRLVKSEDGTSRLVPADSFDKVPQLAGVGGRFDLTEQYGIDEKLVEAFDIATSLAFASGLEALKDAGLPLFPVEQSNSSGLRVIRGWNLPEGEKDRTGVIFASVFPGLEKAIEHALRRQSTEYDKFDRKYLLQVLSMGHSQFASWIGARGPNLAINNACASTPAAFAIAEDWMARGRCDRVIIVSGDDSTSDVLMPWVGAGFSGAGAHAMGNDVTQVALPFDARRHGMLLGMGGAGFVLERRSDAEVRGVTPYVELLGAEIANSAFHPTRLDTDHAASVMESFVGRMERKWKIERGEMADRMTFMSHEPYTPPRGGSASAEVSALRHVFGNKASQILITNAKGYTGHPMGVGLEDAVVIRSLAAGVFPPVANYEVEDKQLGALNISRGGPRNIDLALRHGAGFGSQIALTFLRKIANSDTERFDLPRITQWALESSGGKSVTLRVLRRKLVAFVDADGDLVGGVSGEAYDPPGVRSETPLEVRTSISDKDRELPVSTDENRIKEARKPIKSKSLQPDGGINRADSEVLRIVSESTGYPEEFIELDADMEGELGIDSIKQAEIMAEIRDRFSLPIDEDFQLREHPTLGHVIGYIESFSNPEGRGGRLEEYDQTIGQVETNSVAPLQSDTPDAPDEDVLRAILPIVAKHTGYPEEFLESDADMEGELGIDSIKQAEIMSDIRALYNLELDEDFQIREYPTLGHVANYVAGYNDPRAVDTVPKPTEEESERTGTIYRHEISDEELCPLEMGTLPSMVLVTRDPHGLSESLVERISSMGGKAKAIDGAIEIDGSTEGACIIHMAPVGAEGDLGSDPDPMSWTLGAFDLLKDIDRLPQGAIGRVVTLSSMDGLHGLRGGEYNSSVAGVHGAVMSFGCERPELDIIAIDLNPDLLVDEEAFLTCILKEISREDGPIEVGIGPGGVRHRLVNRRVEVKETTGVASNDDVWLVSGGAAGVTSECMVEVADSPNSTSPTFILLGRTAFDPDLERLSSMSAPDLEGEKLRLKTAMESNSEDGKVTLREWDEAWQRVIRGVDIHSTLSRLRSRGANAEYVQVDVTSAEMVRHMVRDVIARYGSITGVVHGAGIEDSTPFEHKKEETIKQVLDVKVSGWREIYRSLMEANQDLSFACSFTSVSGRLGNATQLGYCAANRILDAEHSRINGGALNSISISWAPWSGVGMATRGSLETVFNRAGVDMIPLRAGARMFAEEAFARMGKPVLISGELGALDRGKSLRMPEVVLPPAFSSSFGSSSRHPMVDTITLSEHGKRATSATSLSVESHRYLKDHSISGVPYLPGVMALEMMAETVQACSDSGNRVSSFEDVEFGLPVKLTKSTKQIRCTVEAIQGNPVEAYRCKIVSDPLGGRGEPIVHHKATILMTSGISLEPIQDIVPTDEDGSRMLGAADIYGYMFHGPMFQPLKGVVATIETDMGPGIEARVNDIPDLPDPNLFVAHGAPYTPIMTSHPMLIESCFQAAGLTSMDIDAAETLPVGAKRILLPAGVPQGSFTVASVRSGGGPDGTFLHESVVRLNGSPVMRIEGLEMKQLRALEEGNRPGLSEKIGGLE